MPARSQCFDETHIDVLAQWSACLIWDLRVKHLPRFGNWGCAGGMGSLSMSTKREITEKYVREHAAASKKGRGRLLDEAASTAPISPQRLRNDCAVERRHRRP